MLFLFLGIAVVTLMFVVLAMLRGPGTDKMNSQPLLVYVAASLKIPLEQIAADYQRETGVRVDLTFGGSQTLLANIEITKRGDLFLPADDSYLVIAKEKKLVREIFPLAEQTAVLAVPKGNPKNVRTLSDLQNSSLRLSQANPDTAAVGKLLRAATEPSGLWQVLSNHTVVFKPTVVDAANDVKLGAVDAAVVWDSMEKQYPDLEFIRLKELESVRAKVAASVLDCSAQSAAALKFARFICAPDKGLKRFEQNGFVVAQSRP